MTGHDADTEDIDFFFLTSKRLYQQENGSIIALQGYSGDYDDLPINFGLFQGSTVANIIQVAQMNIINKMFNYFLLGSAPLYSISSLPTEIFPAPQAVREPQVPEEEFSRLLERYDQLKVKYQKVKLENNELKEYILQLEDVFKPEGKRKKIKRRTQSELSKEFSCPYPSCKKQYASSLALNLHIRTKHKGGTKKERVQYVKQILQYERHGLIKPQTSLNLCPELLEFEITSYRQKEQTQKVQIAKNNNTQSISSEQASEQ